MNPDVNGLSRRGQWRHEDTNILNHLWGVQLRKRKVGGQLRAYCRIKWGIPFQRQNRNVSVEWLWSQVTDKSA